MDIKGWQEWGMEQGLAALLSGAWSKQSKSTSMNPKCNLWMISAQCK
jgi:hypothetical protein